MSKEISEMIKEIAETRCDSMEIQDLEQFYIDRTIENLENEWDWDNVNIIEMYISEVDVDYIHE